jgi:hypothetical protein
LTLWSYPANANALARSSSGSFIHKPFSTFKENQVETNHQGSRQSLSGS